MATYSCEELMPLELAIHREISFQKRRRADDGLPFQSPFSSHPPLSSSPPLQPILPDSFLLLERDIPRKRLHNTAAAAREVPTAHSLENIPADVAMKREISLQRRAERGTSPPHRCYSAPPNQNLPVGDRNPASLPVRTAVANSAVAMRAHSYGSFGGSSSASSQGIPPTDVVWWKSNVDSSSVGSLQQQSNNQQRRSEQIFCDVCCVSCSGSFSFHQHCEGKQHMAMVEKLKRNKIKCGRFTCDLCKISCPDMTSLFMHRAGKRHAAHLQAIKAKRKIR